jgi:hypothetical protein
MRHNTFYYDAGTSNSAHHIGLIHPYGTHTGDCSTWLPHQNTRIYNNTITKSSSYGNAGIRLYYESGGATYCYSDIIAKNNIIADTDYEIEEDGSTGCTAKFDIKYINNLIRGTADGQDVFRNYDNATNYTIDEAQVTYPSYFSDNIQVNPLFTNSSSHDYTLQSGSPAINAGTHLTTVAVADSGSGTSLVVEDAYYFQDGFNGMVDADFIAVGTVGNTVQI